jgi:hypothetical protein
MLSYSSDPHEGRAWNMSNTPFYPPHEIEQTPAAMREYLRELYRRNPRIFLNAARDAQRRDYYFLGADWMTMPLYDALCRVARAHGFDIGEPLEWRE